jgi:thiosulfate/3-mercaptopyruvate sulfurtransferase
LHNKNSLTTTGLCFPKSEYGCLAKKGEIKTVKVIHFGWCRVIPVLFSLILVSSHLVLSTHGRGETRNASKPSWLVSPEWLKEHLSEKSLLVVDTRSEADYQKGHIPRSVLMDATTLSATTSKEGLRLLEEDLVKKFAPLGISGNETVVFYEDGIGVRAPRAFWYFTYAGYSTGRVLQGGFKAWQEAHFPVSQEKPLIPSSHLVVKANSQVIATTDYVVHRLNDPGTVILDVRSRAEYLGKESNSQTTPSGHIPGARWLEWTQLLEDNVRYFPEAELQKKFTLAGVTPDKEVIVYCHRGNRASSTFLALQLLGFPNVRNYVGSWQEWSTHSELPIAVDELPPAK